MPASIKHLSEYLLQTGQPTMVLFGQWHLDELYYTVKLLNLDQANRKALIRYEDGTECWTEISKLHLQFLASTEPYKSDDDIVCCVCDDGTSDSPNEIILCDICQQSYHQKCHSPKIPNSVIHSAQQKEWACQTCNYMVNQLQKMSSGPFSSTPKASSGQKKALKKADKKIKMPKKLNRIKLPKAPANKQAIEIASDNDSNEIVPGETSSSESSTVDSIEKLNSGVTVEKTQDVVCHVAKALADVENVATQSFVAAISDADINPDPIDKEQSPQPIEQAKTASQPKGMTKLGKTTKDSKMVIEESKKKKIMPEAKKPKIQKPTGVRAPRANVPPPA